MVDFYLMKRIRVRLPPEIKQYHLLFERRWLFVSTIKSFYFKVRGEPVYKFKVSAKPNIESNLGAKDWLHFQDPSEV